MIFLVAALAKYVIRILRGFSSFHYPLFVSKNTELPWATNGTVTTRPFKPIIILFLLFRSFVYIFFAVVFIAFEEILIKVLHFLVAIEKNAYPKTYHYFHTSTIVINRWRCRKIKYIGIPFL